MRLWHKLLLSYLVIIAMMLLVGHTGVRSAAQVGYGFHRVNKELVPLLSLLEDLRFAGQRIVSSTAEYTVISYNERNGDQGLHQEQGLLEAGRSAYHKTLESCRGAMAGTPEERQLFHRVEEAGGRLLAASQRLVALVDSRDRSSRFSQTRARFEKAEEAFLAAVAAAHQHELGHLDHFEKSAFSKISQATSTMTAYLAVAVVICIVLGVFSMFAVSGRLATLQAAARKVASGYLDLKLPRFSNDEIGSLAGSFGTMVEALRESRYKLLSTNIYLDSLIASMIDALIVVGGDGTVQDVNPATCRMLNSARHELIGRPLADLFRNRSEGVAAIMELLARGGQQTVEATLLARDGMETEVSVSASYLMGCSEEEGKFVCICHNISHRKLAEQEIRHLAFYDQLTGLPNRTLFLDRCHQALAQAKRNRTQVALLFFDLDRFKDVNDTLGHFAGDLLLKQVTRRLGGVVRQSDTLARLGGDEFVLLCTAIRSPDDASAVARTLIALFDEPFDLEGTEVFSSASIGIVSYPADGADVATLMKNADLAMYAAKESGRKRFQYFSSQLNLRARERVEIEAGLRQALANRQLSLQYQPQFDLRSGRLIGVEALCRWQHAELGWVPPERFIPAAEQSGLIHSLGEWVLKTACQQARAWHDMGSRISVAVNVSVSQLMVADFADLVERILGQSGLAPDYLELEFTESMVMDKTLVFTAMIRRLKGLGVRLAIDDFGTGYSSLSYLKDFSVDRLKIDKSFVRDLETRSDAIAIVKAMIAIGHSLGFRVLAEGIETDEELHALSVFECDEGQGYHYAPPMHADEVTALLQKEKGGAVVLRHGLPSVHLPRSDAAVAGTGLALVAGA